MSKDTGLKSYIDWVNLLASILTITTIVLLVAKIHLDTLIAIITICVISLFLLFENRYLKTNWRRKKKYPDSFKEINKAFFCLNDLYRNSKKQISNGITIEKSFEDFCSSIAAAFNLITDSKCSVSIKIIKDNVDATKNSNAELITFSRDRDSSIERKDKKYASDLTIQNNSDFESIIFKIKNEDQSPFFFSNNLIEELGYKNSRLAPDYYSKIQNENPIIRKNKKEQLWPLPYKSTIVVPIISYKSANHEHPVFGFLCIDSPDKNVFQKEYDIEILFGIADTLFTYMSNGFLKPKVAAILN